MAHLAQVSAGSLATPVAHTRCPGCARAGRAAASVSTERITASLSVTTVRDMTLSEITDSPLSLTLDQAAATGLIIGIAIWVLSIVLFFLILYAVIVTAIRRGMRDHQLWVEGRQRAKTTTAPQ